MASDSLAGYTGKRHEEAVRHVRAPCVELDAVDIRAQAGLQGAEHYWQREMMQPFRRRCQHVPHDRLVGEP